MPKYTEKKRASNERWDKANLDRISIVVPKGDRDKIKSHVERMGEKSVNMFINRAIKETMERDMEKLND